ncbi:MAG TPA: hypothetical protein VMI31_00965 [Fimbriimonadaceae bacterium]|nr:hypothetical protein [Fimbriimonadaceae bacterium]
MPLWREHLKVYLDVLLLFVVTAVLARSPQANNLFSYLFVGAVVVATFLHGRAYWRLRKAQHAADRAAGRKPKENTALGNLMSGALYIVVGIIGFLGLNGDRHVGEIGRFLAGFILVCGSMCLVQARLEARHKARAKKAALAGVAGSAQASVPAASSPAAPQPAVVKRQ